MADIQLTSGASKHGRKKLSTKVDLTPMVDLGFLLITFSILTTTWTQVRAMRFYTPADGSDITVAQSKTLTIIPGFNNKVFYYHGTLEDALKGKALGFTSYNEQTGIGQLIREKKAILEKSKKGSSKDLVFVITPTANASYKNMVDAIDETLINDVTHYTVTAQNNEQLDALINAGKLEKGF
ncbi:ExbD/TolR family protein [Pinibacter soli]|uniref:Biopolymer transporter ExbD n=1 Tax=Pinibacter soli TaxID=3044211 RepID=A0ABT6RIZ9_9BACT|nr:biopolymer transporter ExbD [Pinibacter soli]MDI3322534.1 biopolymer transporter ExbD [Pinibacter soli]